MLIKPELRRRELILRRSATLRAAFRADDSDPTFHGTVYALVVISIFCSMGLAIGMVLGIN